MGRRKKKDDVGMDLFSFLNIMTATIGVNIDPCYFCPTNQTGSQSSQTLASWGEGKAKSGNYISNQNGELDMLIKNQRLTMNVNNDNIDSIIEDLSSDETPQYLVLGVRPEVIYAEKLRSKAEFNKLEYGYEPIESDLEVQFPQS